MRDKEGNVNVDELAIDLQGFLRMFHELSWNDKWCTEAYATALFSKIKT